MSAHEAGLALRRLLEYQPEYREIWGQHVARRRSDLSVAAICHVLAIHLWDTGERPESATELPRQLRDLVGRAMAGEVLTMKTLRWFADAFKMPTSDYDQLFRLLTASPAQPVHSGSSDRKAKHHTENHDAVRILHAHIEHCIGSDGAIERTEHIRFVETPARRLTTSPSAVIGTGSRELIDLIRAFERADLPAAEGPVDCPHDHSDLWQRRMVRWVVNPKRTTERVSEIREVLSARYESVTLQIRFSGQAPHSLNIAISWPDSDICTAQTLRPDDDNAFILHLDDPAGRTACCSWIQADDRGQLRAAG